MGTALTLGMGFSLPRQALAQSAAEAVHNFSQESQPLRSAVAAFSRASGVSITADGAIPASVTAGRVSGTMSVRQGVDRLLSGTGYSYRFAGGNSVILLAPKAGSSTEELSFEGLLTSPVEIKGGTGLYHASSNFQEPASIIYRDSRDIQRFRGVSPGDFLKGEAGVSNGDNRNSGGLDVNVRGMQGQNRVPVVIDGSFQESTVYRGYSGIAGRTYLDPDLIGSFSIEKGPSSGADAAGATGGVVRVETLRPDDIIAEGETQGIRIKAGLTSNTAAPPSTGTFGGTMGPDSRFDRPGALEFGEAWNGSIAAVRKFGNFQILGAYARRHTGNYFAGTRGEGPRENGMNPYNHGEEVLNTSQDNTSALLRGIYQWGNGHSADVAYMRYESDFGELMPSQIIRFGGPSQSDLSRVEVDTVTARYRWKPEDSSWINFKADLYYTHNLTNINTNYIFGAPPQGFVLPFVYASEAEQWGLNLSNASEFALAGRALALSYGVSGKREFLRPPSDLMSYQPDSPFGTIDGEIRDGWRDQFSGFVAAEYQATERLTLNGSLRYTQTESHDNTPTPYYVDNGSGGLTRHETFIHRKTDGLTPILSALYEIRPGLQVYGKYAEAIRTPSLFESTRGWSAAPSSRLGLKPEHAKTQEIGVNFERDGLFSQAGMFQAKLAYFDNKVDDYITRRNFNFVNIQKARLKGWEMALNYDNGRFFGSLSGAKYISTEYCDADGICSSGGTFGGYAHLHVPPEESATLTFGARLLDEKLELGGRVTFVGDRASTDFSSGTGDTNRAVTWEPYTTVDLFGSYKLSDSVTLDAAIDNVTDAYYMDSLTIGLMPSPGRTVRIGLTSTF